MRISELSRATGVRVATVKYYLREGLLHEGELTSATQARYGESHIARLRLVRALLGAGGLSVAAARAVLDQLDDPPESTHRLLGVAHQALGDAADASVDTSRAEALVAELGWQVHDAGPEPLRRLAAALAALEAADFQLPDSVLLAHARDIQRLADREVAGVPTSSREAAVRYVVLGTILAEPLLLALRRLAQVDASARRFGSAQ